MCVLIAQTDGSCYHTRKERESHTIAVCDPLLLLSPPVQRVAGLSPVNHRLSPSLSPEKYPSSGTMAKDWPLSLSVCRGFLPPPTTTTTSLSPPVDAASVRRLPPSLSLRRHCPTLSLCRPVGARLAVWKREREESCVRSLCCIGPSACVAPFGVSPSSGHRGEEKGKGVWGGGRPFGRWETGGTGTGGTDPYTCDWANKQIYTSAVDVKGTTAEMNPSILCR